MLHRVPFTVPVSVGSGRGTERSEAVGERARSLQTASTEVGRSPRSGVECSDQKPAESGSLVACTQRAAVCGGGLPGQIGCRSAGTASADA